MAEMISMNKRWSRNVFHVAWISSHATIAYATRAHPCSNDAANIAGAA